MLLSDNSAIGEEINNRLLNDNFPQGIDVELSQTLSSLSAGDKIVLIQV